VNATPNDVQTKSAAMCKADGWLYENTGATTGMLSFTFYKTFIVPLNVLNQIFDTSNMFYISLMKNQALTLNLFILQYSMARVFGTETLFDTYNTGIIDTDLILITKDSEVIKNDIERSGDSIVKYFQKYQYSLLPVAPADQ
jgi:hypothetical protein